MALMQRWMASGQAFWPWEVRWIASCWEVSSCGRVRSRRGIVSHGTLTASGYRQVNIDSKLFYVHRLVAATFLGPPPASARWLVNHVDSNKSNNHVWNLQYVTASENLRHSWDTNESRRSNAGKLSKAVYWRVYGHELWSLAHSQAELVRMLGATPASVSRCYLGLATYFTGRGTRYELKAARSPPLSIEGELWQPAVCAGEDNQIPGLMVSSYGRILSSSPSHEYVSHGYQTTRGYFTVTKASRTFFVHRLVAGTFLGPPVGAKCLVNHRDANKGNNRVENLEYVTPSENRHHAIQQRVGRRPQAINSKAVQVRSKGACDKWLQYDSIKAAALHTGTKEWLVSSICKSHEVSDRSCKWDFRFAREEPLPGEEWRPVVFNGARAPTAAEKL